ncbi:MAG: hypothetical protein IPP97_11125 [Candidatus Obscuribacter sp.]|nr:hypothetical protein [Candidatus Obscuribacter sp.]MBP7578059.1 hypothetical protein [Candidatus Obscuribacter sp.]
MKKQLLITTGLLIAACGVTLGAIPSLGAWAFTFAVCYALSSELSMSLLLAALFSGILALSTAGDAFLAISWSGASLFGLGLYLIHTYGKSTQT